MAVPGEFRLHRERRGGATEIWCLLWWISVVVDICRVAVVVSYGPPGTGSQGRGDGPWQRASKGVAVLADIPRMTWGPTVISCEKKPNRTCRHDGWELSELTGRRRKIDRPLKNTARRELEAPVAIDPERLQFRFTHRVGHDRTPGIAAIY